MGVCSSGKISLRMRHVDVAVKSQWDMGWVTLGIVKVGTARQFPSVTRDVDAQTAVAGGGERKNTSPPLNPSSLEGL